MKSLLPLLCVAVCTSALEVNMSLSADGRLCLRLVGDEDTSQFGSVTFTYRVDGQGYIGRAQLSNSGWTLEPQGLRVGVTSQVTARAHVYDVTGHLTLTTDTATELTEEPALPALPSRQIRSAIIFRDDFTSFDRNNWDMEVSMYGGMNWEFQVYTNDQKNVFVQNGNLVLMPTKTVDDPRFSGNNYLKTGKMDMSTLFGSCTQSANYGCTREGKYGMLPPVMSGKVKSRPTLKYGKVTVRARIPRGDWIWPAIWMLPRSDKYGTWPRSGEIDIMESRGNTGDIGVGSVSSTLHWGPDFNNNRYSMTTGAQKSADWSNQFHTWTLTWNQDHIMTEVDGQKVMDVNPGSSFWNYGNFGGGNIWGGNKMAPFDQEFYLIFNVAVGGTNNYFPDSPVYGGTTKPWSNTSPHAAEDFWNARGAWGPTWQGDKVAMMVDYVQFESL